MTTEMQYDLLHDAADKDKALHGCPTVKVSARRITAAPRPRTSHGTRRRHRARPGAVASESAAGDTDRASKLAAAVTVSLSPCIGPQVLLMSFSERSVHRDKIKSSGYSPITVRSSYIIACSKPVAGQAENMKGQMI